VTVARDEATVPTGELAAVLAPRDGLVRERAAGDGRFELAEGPFWHYERTVEVRPLDDGHSRVVQRVAFRLAVPYFGWLFVLPVRARLARIGPDGGPAPWWAPPDRLDARAATVLGTLAALSMITGFLSTLLNQTVAFAAEEFGAAEGAQGVAATAVRIGTMLAVAIVARADRRGRRRVTLLAATVGCVASSLGAFAPSLAWLTGTQVVGRAFATAMIALIAIIAVEEMPAGARAYAVSLLAMAGGLGAGVCILSLPIADLGVAAWRVIYLLALAGLPIVASARRHLPESRRFTAPHRQARLLGHGRRFWLLAASLFLSNLFVAPASFFGNRYLHNERGFSAGDISLFQVVTGLPAVLGIVFGGRWADIHGRRRVGAVATAVGTIGGAATFWLAGWPLWVAATVGATIGQAATPALAVYGPELFPTSLRGTANGLIAVIGLAGSAAGLLVAGFAAEQVGRLGPGMAALAAGPLTVSLLILVAYPETAHRELEELNPEDRPPTA
jgi:MFS family permease